MNETSHQLLRDYYAERAPVYERVYGYPERQRDLRTLSNLVGELCANRRVLELAAGTGYWTQTISRTAESVLATDVNREVLLQLEERALPGVATQVLDSFALGPPPQGPFDAVFAGLWFSHLKIAEREAWLAGVHAQLPAGGMVVLLDNSDAQRLRLPVAHTDAEGNTYQDRQTDAGNSYRIVKNFPAESELAELTRDAAAESHYVRLQHYWLFHYLLH